MKHCKVTKLDDVFWRVDWEGGPLSRVNSATSPQTVKLGSGLFYFSADPFRSRASLHELLASVGLTTEPPKEETAGEATPKHHDLKCEPEPFAAVVEGRKRMEFRKDDRGFSVGDTVTLHELTAVGGEKTGNKYTFRISHILRDTAFGVPLGYAVLSIGERVLSPKPETAEERVLAALAEAVDCIVVAKKEDIRSVLAELDRLRARETKFALGPSADAVLAPIRDLIARAERHMRSSASLGRQNADDGSFRFAAEDFHMASEWFCVADALQKALAESEKIARGEK